MLFEIVWGEAIEAAAYRKYEWRVLVGADCQRRGKLEPTLRREKRASPQRPLEAPGATRAPLEKGLVAWNLGDMLEPLVVAIRVHDYLLDAKVASHRLKRLKAPRKLLLAV